MSTSILDALQYDDDRTGILRLYVFHPSGMGYEVRQYFSRHIRYPDEEISVADAREIASAAVAAGKEVRITNCGDLLIFHARAGAVLFPLDGEESFWRSIQ